jgi:hypothetical protein
MSNDNNGAQLDAVWQKRFDSLDSQITALIKLIDDSPLLYRQSTLSKLAHCLQEFAGAQFDYFFEGFNRKDNPLSPSPEYPPKHVITVTLQQISYDLEAIKWSVEQRLHGGPETVKALQIGDKLAWGAMQPALNSFDLGENVSVVTYFQKFAEIRVIPYAPVALIGLPITCIRSDEETIVARDYLATPHEVGHYVYWHAKMPADAKSNGEASGQPLYQYLAKQVKDIPFALEWLEEVFADVYGCLVAGPIIAQSFQDLQLRIRQKYFFTDDGKHPTPYIRPDIYTKVLHKRFKPGWDVKLDQRWQGKREERKKRYKDGELEAVTIHYKNADKIEIEKKPADFITMLDSHDHTLLAAGADKPVDIMINTVLAAIGEVVPPTWWWSNDYIGNEPSAELDLYTQFEQAVLNEETSIEDQQLAAQLDGGTIVCKEGLQVQWETETANGEQAQGQVEAVDDEEPAWINVFRAGGWATKGPQTNPVSG